MVPSLRSYCVSFCFCSLGRANVQKYNKSRKRRFSSGDGDGDIVKVRKIDYENEATAAAAVCDDVERLAGVVASVDEVRVGSREYFPSNSSLQFC